MSIKSSEHSNNFLNDIIEESPAQHVSDSCTHPRPQDLHPVLTHKKETSQTDLCDQNEDNFMLKLRKHPDTTLYSQWFCNFRDELPKPVTIPI